MRHLARAEEYIAIMLLGLMTALVFSQVCLRFLFGLGYGWIDELARLSFIWLVYLGAVAGMQRGLHIRVDTFVRLIPDPLGNALVIFGDLLLAAFCLAMTCYGVQLVTSTLKFSFDLPATGLSMFWVYMIIPLSFGLQIVRLLTRTVRNDREPEHVE